MRLRSRGTTLALAGLLALGGTAACSEEDEGGNLIEQEGDIGGEDDGGDREED